MSTAHNAINNSIGTSGTTTNLSMIRSASGLWQAYDDQTDTFGFYNNAGTPEAAVAANIGSLCTDTTNGDVYVKSTDTVNTGWNIIGSAASFSVVNQTFTGNGTYTPTAGMVYCQIQIVGGGGGSGGCESTAGGESSAGAGGAGAEYASGIFTAATIGVSQVATVGAAGAAAAIGDNPGGTGGTTSIGALITAGGGVGGQGGPAGAGSVEAGGTGGTGGAGGDYRIQGQPGQQGVTVAAGSVRHGGAGGDSMLGFGAPSEDLNGVASTQAGHAGTGYGSGAGSGCLASSQTQLVGIAGQPGVIIITEWVIS